ncbi:hypothetical protein CR969_01300 [Candidatus Saccharibacteria bacterium]|nr:MAG: hypothetical protein CR969_01300 [Candidatus Saccharibacteria bacterium]
MKDDFKKLFIVLVTIISVAIIIATVLFWWQVLTFPSYVPKQLGISKDSLDKVNISQSGRDKEAARDLILIAEIKPEVRDALLEKKFVFDDCYDPCSDKDIEDKRNNPDCRESCSQDALKLFKKDNDLVRYIVKDSIDSGDIYCAFRQQRLESGRTRSDTVCLSPDSNKIRYSSYEPGF